MTVADLDLGPRWRWLQARGWQIRPLAGLPATGVTDAGKRTIWLAPRAFARPSRRVRRFVIPHEIVHALHSEQGYEVHEIVLARDIPSGGAIEAVANGALLMLEPTREMRLWVAASCAWHRRQRYGRLRYSLRDCRAPETVARIRAVLAQVD